MNEQMRRVEKVYRPEATSDGAGVSIKRLIASSKLDYLDPFLLFDHFGSDNPEEYGAGFPTHPHRGIETVTYMLAGVVAHRDSMGNRGEIGPGDVQWMTAGSGVMHEEMPQTREGRMEGFQLWVNLPAARKMSRPRYQEYQSRQIPLVNRPDGAQIRVIAGEVDGVKGPVAEIAAAPTYMDVTLPAGISFRQAVARGHAAFAYVFEGGGDFGATGDGGGERVDAASLVVFGDGDAVEIKASEAGARFLLVSGQPLREPVARYGPFVMNTREQVYEALEDLRHGTFVKERGKDDERGEEAREGDGRFNHRRDQATSA